MSCYLELGHGYGHLRGQVLGEGSRLGIGLEIRVKAVVREQRSGLEVVLGEEVSAWGHIECQCQGWEKV